MPNAVQWPVSLALLAGLAGLLARAPRRLIQYDLGVPHERVWEVGLAVGLGALSIGAFLVLDKPPRWPERLALASAVSTLAAVLYYDLRFLVIPDLCNLAVVLLGLLSPLALPIRDALFGAGVCAALVGAVAWIWRVRTGTDGMGFGDVKLSAALGGLLGLQPALWMIASAALVGAVLGYLVRWFVPAGPAKGEITVVPFGAALAFAGGTILVWMHR